MFNVHTLFKAYKCPQLCAQYNTVEEVNVAMMLCTLLQTTAAGTNCKWYELQKNVMKRHDKQNVARKCGKCCSARILCVEA